MAKRKYDDCFLKPEITQAGEYQIFKMKGKDARGFDWMVRLAPITEMPVDLEVTAVANRAWPQQRTWLQATYPPEVAWNLPFNINHLTPSFWSSFLRTLNGKLSGAVRRQQRSDSNHSKCETVHKSTTKLSPSVTGRELVFHAHFVPPTFLSHKASLQAVSEVKEKAVFGQPPQFGRIHAVQRDYRVAEARAMAAVGATESYIGDPLTHTRSRHEYSGHNTSVRRGCL